MMIPILRIKLEMSIFLLSFLYLPVLGQVNNYNVLKAPFSSNRYDEFCPVYYNGGIVFCSNLDVDFLNKYSNQQGKGFFKIFYTDTALCESWKDTRLFSRELKTKLNDGPVSFSSDGKTIYFSRNIYIEGSISELSSTRNKLGLFYSQYDGNWKEPKSFRYNNEWYNITDPCLSPDGTRLYFVSDKSGGYGGTDIYYCDWMGDFWGEPVNPGTVINTPANESYPFAGNKDELFFSSDKPGGLGGKDIYFTKYVDSAWLEPVLLKAPINSKYDDFGLVTDPIMSRGYFSTNRNGSYDIYSFTTLMPQFFYCQQQRINNYCFQFKNGPEIDIDPSSMLYQWSFDDTKTIEGKDVEHCFKGPGVYNAEEHIVNKDSGRKLFVKQQISFEIKEIEQPFISSDDFAIVNEDIEFDTQKSYFTDKMAHKYYWDFGDGSVSYGAKASHKFTHAGEYRVKLAISLEDLKSGQLSRPYVYKTIRVFNSLAEERSHLSDYSPESIVPEVSEYDHVNIISSAQFASDSSNNILYSVVLFSSKSHNDLKDPSFRNIDNKYFIREEYNSETGLFKYIIGEELDFLNAYTIYNDALSLGFKDVEIQHRILTSPEEQNLNQVRHIYGDCADDFFEKYDSRLNSTGFTFLDQIVTLLNRYPDCNLLIETQTDRAGNAKANHQLSVQRNLTIVKYLISRGIDSKRLTFRGYGDTRPFARDNSEKERRRNQRVVVTLLK